MSVLRKVIGMKTHELHAHIFVHVQRIVANPRSNQAQRMNVERLEVTQILQRVGKIEVLATYPDS